ncbi:MAG: iron ABC transporter permease [Chloroflexi bacterium]|nr:iron ABC transporter permease [Chloroflexota bacterium]
MSEMSQLAGKPVHPASNARIWSRDAKKPRGAPLAKSGMLWLRAWQSREFAGARPKMLAALLMLLVALLLLSLSLGSASIPFDQILIVLTGGEADQRAWTSIVLKFRLPKTLTAMLAGMALGVSGLLMQTYFRNPLAEPFVLGVSSGASLGVALVVLTSGAAGGALLAGLGLAGDLLLTVAAGFGAAMTMGVVLFVALRVQSSVTLLILGLMFGYLVAAMVSLLLYFALPERIQAYINWTFGSFSGVTIEQLPILALFALVGLLLSAALVKPLNALLLGEDYARSLGVNLKWARIGIVVATATLVSAVTAFCGPIAFIGIAVPHLCRGLLASADHRLLLPGACLAGACVALCASLIAELPGNNLVLPLNVVTAILGAPVVILVVLRHARGKL